MLPPWENFEIVSVLKNTGDTGFVLLHSGEISGEGGGTYPANFVFLRAIGGNRQEGKHHYVEIRHFFATLPFSQRTCGSRVQEPSHSERQTPATSESAPDQTNREDAS